MMPGWRRIWTCTACGTATSRTSTEFGYPARFVQEQVGHSHASTTAIYMGVSNEYRNKLLAAAMKERLGDDWNAPAMSGASG